MSVAKVLVVFLLLMGSKQNAEAVSNAGVDYFTTIRGIQSQFWTEGNPLAAEIFRHTNYRQQYILGCLYLVGLSQLHKLPKPYSKIIIMAFDAGHFWGASTWDVTGYLRYPVKLTLLRLEW